MYTCKKEAIALPDTIEKIFLWAGLDAVNRQQMISQLPAPLSFEKGESISSEKRLHRSLAIILQGQVEVFRTGQDGRRVMMNRLSEGHMFGAASLFGDTDGFFTEVTRKR